MKNISEILASVEETPVTFEDYLKAYADPVGELINSYIPHGTHGDMDRYLYDPLYHYSENAGKRHRPLICFAACLAVGTWISALTENQIIAYLATFGALLIAYLMNGIKTMFTSGNLLALIGFLGVLLIAAVLVGVLCKSLPVGLGVFGAGAVVLVVLFQLRPAWLLSAFNAVLGALALFQPFNGVVGGMFSVSAIVYYLSVIALFLFLTGQSLERRRWH